MARRRQIENKIENNVSMGTFDGKEIKVHTNWQDESEPAEFTVEIGDETKRYKSLKGAKDAIRRMKKKVSKRVRPRIRCCWIGLVDKQGFSSMAGEFRLCHGWFIGHSTRSGRPEFELDTKEEHEKKYDPHNMYAVYAYVPGYTEKLTMDLVHALNVHRAGERALKQAEEGMHYIVDNSLNADRHRDYSKSAKIDGIKNYESGFGRKIETEQAIDRDEKTVAILAKWQDHYKENSDRIAKQNKRRRRG